MSEIERRNPVLDVCRTIDSREFAAKLLQALPPTVTLDRFKRTALTAIQQQPELVTGSRQSLYNAVIACAKDGLLPDGREAAFVLTKVKGEQVVAYWPMIGGYRKIAAKHGYVLEAFVVYEHDQFTYTLGFDPTVIHRPPPLGDDRGEPIGAYAVATRLGDRQKFLGAPMSRADIEKVRDVSRAGRSEYGPWVNWWEQMACKTVARRLFKTLPLGDLDDTDQRIAATADNEADLPDQPHMTIEETTVAVSLQGSVPDTPPPDDKISDAEFIEAGGGTEHPAADADAATPPVASSPAAQPTLIDVPPEPQVDGEPYDFEQRAAEAQARRARRKT